MKTFTQEEAIKEIFEAKNPTSTMRVLKHRYAKKLLSQKAIDEILKNHNFVTLQEKLYLKKEDEHTPG